MTESQTQAIADVRKLMNANFDSWVLSHKLVSENLRSSIGQDWHGDISDVIGLTDVTKSRLIAIANSNPGHSQEVGV